MRVVRGGKTVATFGDPPKPRIATMEFDSMEKAQVAFDSSAYKEAKKVNRPARAAGVEKARAGGRVVAESELVTPRARH
jgi:uncharacterized protein (DUF1330 family)